MRPVNAMARWLLIATTILLVWGALAIGSDSGIIDLKPGDVSPEQFIADHTQDVDDTEATEVAREEAAAAVELLYFEDREVTATIEREIRDLFTQIQNGVVADDPILTVEIDEPIPPDPIATTSTTVAADPDTTSTTVATSTTVVVVPTGVVGGILYLDRTGDGLYSPTPTETSPNIDVPMVDVDVIITDAAGEITRVRTDSSGTFLATGISADGPAVVAVDTRDPQFPDSFALSTANNPQVIEVVEDETADIASIGFTAHSRPIADQVADLAADYAIDTDATQPSLATLVGLAVGDVWREAADEDPQLPEVLEAATARARDVLGGDGIKSGELSDVRVQVADQRIFIPLDLDTDEAVAAEDAARAIAAAFLEPNSFADDEATEVARQVARANVGTETVTYLQGALIVDANEVVSQVQYDAIIELGLLNPTTTQYMALLVATAAVIVVLAFYISRFRPGLWASLRRITLFGMLLVLLALSVRAAAGLGTVMADLEVAGGYAVPAAAFGVMVAILFDARMAVLMAAAAAAVTALATGDPGYTIYALLSGFVPIPFVSSISRRADFGGAVVVGAFGAAATAAAISFYFHAATVDEAVLTTVGLSALVAGTVTLVTALAAGMAVSFFELTFDITTSLRLLDLTNRNHPALQLLQDEAWGTFNHSLMVGTLADKAAFSIGANNLLARAAAYYHDLGKTASATYFIENQFGISNPHDQLPPAESAAVIRQHVTDGVALAKEYRIPSEVAEGILSHHGDGIMRYFYEKAKELYGESAVNVDHYRHIGHKPRSREMAILMMADALEGATRAVFSNEAPTPERIVDIVERVVGEKVNDGQLSESDLTLGELTQVKAAFVAALVGHYHQRIPYPNFPDADGLTGGTRTPIDPRSDDDETGATLDVPSVDSEDAASDVIPMRRNKER